MLRQEWGSMLIVLTHGRVRQEDGGLKTALSYIDLVSRKKGVRNEDGQADFC